MTCTPCTLIQHTAHHGLLDQCVQCEKAIYMDSWGTPRCNALSIYQVCFYCSPSLMILSKHQWSLCGPLSCCCWRSVYVARSLMDRQKALSPTVFTAISHRHCCHAVAPIAVFSGRVRSISGLCPCSTWSVAIDHYISFLNLFMFLNLRFNFSFSNMSGCNCFSLLNSPMMQTFRRVYLWLNVRIQTYRQTTAHI